MHKLESGKGWWGLGFLLTNKCFFFHPSGWAPLEEKEGKMTLHERRVLFRSSKHFLSNKAFTVAALV